MHYFYISHIAVIGWKDKKIQQCNKTLIELNIMEHKSTTIKPTSRKSSQVLYFLEKENINPEENELTGLTPSTVSNKERWIRH